MAEIAGTRFRLESHVLEESNSAAYLLHVVDGLLNEHIEETASYDIEPAKSVQALALIGKNIRRGSNGVALGYDYAYQADDALDGKTKSGIVVANPVIPSPFRGIYDRSHTVRHYQEDGDGTVNRTDYTDGRWVFKIELDDEIDSPLDTESPSEDFVMREFKADVLKVLGSTPVIPMTNLLHALVDL